MGVPKFFRYISERYPCLSELVKEYQIPEFDNLYLDMNGIIHMCSHPDDYDPHFRMSEEKMFSDIFHYIEVLFRMIKPQKLFFMAVDGVAPRAKMNQQRGRRFRSAKDAEVLEAKAKERGEELPTEARFDSNCITPGTVFMDRLHQQLKYFVANKISNDRLWQHCKIILSGHETPGEGEHKIMDYIRFMKAQAGYDPNTRHCLYGLDADLIMLGLCSHEPHFSLLREEVRFGKKAKRKSIPEHITFYLLHLSLMREYLELEFMPLKDTLPFEYDMEKIIDDWVLMGFLVGNDFIPNLPNLHISNGALPILYNAYMKILPTLNGYINEAGSLNLERFEKFMVALASIDMDNFSEQYADLKYFQSKTGRKPNNKERTSYRNKNLIPWDDEDEKEGTERKPINPELEALIKSTDQYFQPKKTGWDDEITTVSEIKFQPAKNLDLEALMNSTSDMFSVSTSSSNNVGILIEPLEDMSLDQRIENSEVDKIAKGFIGDLLEKAVVEVNKDVHGTAQNVEAVEIKTENETSAINEAKEQQSEIIEEQKNLVVMNQTKKTQKATEVVLVEPSESNLDDLALDMIDLEEDPDEASPYYTESESDSESDELMEAEFLQHKNDYYMNKLDYSKITPEVMRSQAEGYVRAIQWNLNYYYNGCCSWSWYYPHHYAPYISDIKDFSCLKLEFDMGRPFHPFEQLLAVLPSASKTLLPAPYQELMVSEESPIIKYYPADFKTDLNGKKQEWEAVVLIPFIAENLLLESMAPCYEKLTEDEIRRNTHGPMLVYEYSAEDMGPVKAPQYFPAIQKSHAKLTPVTMEEIRVPQELLVKGPCPGAITDTYYPGFPTFKHIKYTGTLEKAKVKVFDQPSQNENMIIAIEHQPNESTLIELAHELVGKSVFISWPHLTEALVVAVSDCTSKVMVTSTAGEFSTEVNKGNLNALWHTMKNGCINHYKDRLGIDVGKVSVLVHVKGACGQKYVYTQTGSISVEKQWNIAESIFPLQAVVRQLNVSVSAQLTFTNIQQLFPIGCEVFMLGHPHYGAMGEVIDNTTLKSGRIKVNMSGVSEPDFSSLYKFQQELKYLPAGIASQRLAITPHLLSRITGSIFVVPAERMHDSKMGNRINIGLNLKLNKKNEEIPGYTKKVDGQWLYSPKAIQLVKDYMNTYPGVFSFIQSHLGNDVLSEQELFPGDDCKSKIREVTEWIKKQPFSSIEHQTVGSQVADPEIVKRIEDIVDNFNTTYNTPKQVVMQVKPHLLYKPEVQTGFLPPDLSTMYRLYDRVVNVRASYTVPYGCKGTVIGIQANTKADASDDMEIMYDIVFDQQFAGGLQLNCSPNRGYRCPKPALINITHGMRVVQQKTVNPVTNNPWYGAKNPQNRPQQGASHQSQMRGQNSAFANWNSGAQGYQQQQQTQGMPLHAMPYAPRQGAPMPGQYQPPLRPPGVQAQSPQRPPQQQQGAGAEFHAFFKDLQRNQGKQTAPIIFPSHNLQRSASGPVTPFNQAQNFPVQPTLQSVEQGATDETEALKKLLKISEKKSPASSPNISTRSTANDVTNAPPISVQDFFAHARSQEQSGNRLPQQNKSATPYFCVQLLNYCQANGKGIPRYNYFTVGDKFRAQIVLSDGRAVIGDELTSKADASENAAKIIMNDIINGTTQSQNGASAPPNWEINPPRLANYMNPSGFPNPPKQWCQKDNSKPQASHKTSPQKHAKNTTPRSSSDKKGDSNSTFVPLQAVKQQRNKSNSSSSEGSGAPKNLGSTGNKGMHYSSPTKNKASSSGDKQKNSQSDSTPKPKTRKSRIAANFSGISPSK